MAEQKNQYNTTGGKMKICSIKSLIM